MSDQFTTRLPLSRSAVDRDHTRRDAPDLIGELWAQPGTRVIALWHGRALHAPAAGALPARLDLVAPNRLPEPALALYLGRSLDAESLEPVGTALLAVELTDAQARALHPAEEHWIGLRDSATALSGRDTGLFAETLGVLNWHHSHGFCPRCGTATLVESAGWVRRCPACGASVFPRTDPAVIMLITDAADRLLLGSNALWENNRYSLLAGFVEPGESFEAAVIRESFEESGLRVTDAQYVGSQPWPFPASVMVGFTARLAADQSPSGLLPDGDEILDLRWFSRAELREAEASWLILPGASSIAHALIARWLDGDPTAEGDLASVSTDAAATV